MEPTSISYTGVVVGAVVAFLVGWLWYSPKLFGKGWAEGSGVELGSANSMPMMAMGTQALALLVLSLVVGITATTDALWTAILAILAAALFVASAGAFVKKSQYAVMVDFGYIIVAGILMIIAQGIF